MIKNIFFSFIFSLYDLLWLPALPILHRNKRLKEGWERRVLKDDPLPRADLWIQAASGGEAYLAWELLKNMETGGPATVLATTNTSQGLDILKKAAVDVAEKQPGLTLHLSYFPFDRPTLMNKALEQVRPRTAVLLESEIWPGFIRACHAQGTEVLLVNGRITGKSLKGYMKWPSFFREFAPDRILAMSEDDAKRFRAIYGSEKTGVMSNIKFDRLDTAATGPESANPLAPLVGDSPFIVLGSVREEEEEQVEKLLLGLLEKKPDTLVGLFPRHMHRLDHWRETLDRNGLDWSLRSETDKKGKGVILWDTFGEMMPAYALARAAFVGGSLAPLGGQNFLEPLTCGIVPVIGPHWSNFHWVGREIMELGLVRRTENWQEALSALLELTDAPPSKEPTIKALGDYVRDRRGGSQSACKLIADSMNKE